MRKLFSYLAILVTLCYTSQVHAQKAYEIISYKAKVYGSPAKLAIADGYLLASKIIIYSSYGTQTFAPNANDPDTKGELRFEPVKGTGRYKDNSGSWLTLKGLNSSDYPYKLNAVFWDGKMLKQITFRR
jgi:hypothetical protein